MEIKNNTINVDFLFEKTVDQSVLKEGLSVPAGFQTVLFEKLGKKLNFGESMPIEIMIEKETYGAVLKNQFYDKGKYPKRTDIVQIRYGHASDIAVALRTIFYATQNLIDTTQTSPEKGRMKSYIPDELQEYVRIYTTSVPNTLQFECIPLAQEMEIEIIQNLDDETLRNVALHRSEFAKEPVVKSTVMNYRDTYISEYSKRRAKGRCQLCLLPAPFLNKEGEPYLESHHIEWLSKGGKDSIDNVVALCPNCHRKMHILNDKKDVEFLKKMITGGE